MDARFEVPIPEGYVIYCGIFTVKGPINVFFKDKTLWSTLISQMGFAQNALKNGLPEKIELSEEGAYGRKDMLTLFYEGVVNGIYPSTELCESAPYKYMSHYRIVIDCDIPLLDCTETIKLRVRNLEFYILSKDCIIYTIETDISGKNLKELSLLNRVIRNVEYYQYGYKGYAIHQSFLNLFLPVIQIHNKYDKTNLPMSFTPTSLKQFAYDLFRGNKLQSYIAIGLPEQEGLFTEDYSMDNLLYEIGTCSEMGLMLSPNDNYYPDLRYYKELISNNTFSCFSNWKAISLLDSFAIVFKNGTSINKAWRHCYFQYLYINALCIRSFLVIINEKYKRKDMTESVENDFLDFDKIFNFQKVAYTFLPDLIYKKMRYGLQIDEELQIMEDKICKFSEKQYRKSERNTNNVLFLLAILALFSAFTDAFQLFKDIEVFKLFHINPDNSDLLLIKHVYFISLIILIVICVLYKVNTHSIYDRIKSFFLGNK